MYLLYLKIFHCSMQPFWKYWWCATPYFFETPGIHDKNFIIVYICWHFVHSNNVWSNSIHSMVCHGCCCLFVCSWKRLEVYGILCASSRFWNTFNDLNIIGENSWNRSNHDKITYLQWQFCDQCGHFSRIEWPISTSASAWCWRLMLVALLLGAIFINSQQKVIFIIMV